MDPSPRTVAVIIVTYKSAALTVACLESVALERAASGIELRAIVVDNASGDAVEIARAIETAGWHSWVTLIEAPRNGGFAYGNNLGLAHACKTGAPHYFHLLNPDTRVKPGAIGTLLDFLERHPNAGIAGSSFENGDGSDWPIAFRFPSLLSEIDAGLRFGPASRLLERWAVARSMPPDRVEQIDWGAGASMMVKRELLEAIGGLDENYFLYFEETEFCWRARKAGYSMWYIPASRVIHIAGQSTKVTERGAALKRLPPYWFESRRRYFRTTGSLARAIAIDIVAVAASALGSLRLSLQGKRRELVPHYVRDLLSHSVMRKRNRRIEAPRTAWRVADPGGYLYSIRRD